MMSEDKTSPKGASLTEMLAPSIFPPGRSGFSSVDVRNFENVLPCQNSPYPCKNTLALMNMNYSSTIALFQSNQTVVHVNDSNQGNVQKFCLGF